MAVTNVAVNGKHKLAASTPSEPTKFMQDIAIDNSGKQNIMSTDGFWFFQMIICKKDELHLGPFSLLNC